MGPVANDQLYATIRLYEQRVVTAEATIEMLKAHVVQSAFISYGNSRFVVEVC